MLAKVVRFAMRATLIQASLSLPTPALSAEIDITKFLHERTRIDEEVSRLCDRLCMGNEKKSWLEKGIVRIDPGSSPTVIVLDLRLRNRHVPFAGAILYDDTANVEVRAKIDGPTCTVKDIEASSSNEIYKTILNVFQGELDRELRKIDKVC